MMVLGSPMTETLNTETTGLNDSFMDPLLDTLPNAHFDTEFNFDFNDHSYRYHEASTPCSSLSPASSGPLQSPASYSILGQDPSVSSPSPPPSTKQLTEFLHASSNTQYPFEADFSKLTLTGNFFYIFTMSPRFSPATYPKLILFYDPLKKPICICT